MVEFSDILFQKMSLIQIHNLVNIIIDILDNIKNTLITLN